MKALENENVPGNVRQHLGTVKSRFEAHGEDLRVFQGAQHDLMSQQPGQGGGEVFQNIHMNRKRVLDGRNDIMINGSCLKDDTCLNAVSPRGGDIAKHDLLAVAIKNIRFTPGVFDIKP
ncbi:MAG: hypothetical protein U9Q03_03625 [Patescibacteria group bacterium]|nr:hypothetical protein [Patescibacteria group bacterium]